MVKKLLNALGNWLGVDQTVTSWLVAIALLLLLFLCTCYVTWVVRSIIAPMGAWIGAVVVVIVAIVDLLAIVLLWLYFAVPYFEYVGRVYGDATGEIISVSVFSLIALVVVIGGGAAAGEELTDMTDL